MKEFECNSKKSTLGPFHLGDVKIHKSEYLESLLECNDLIWDAGRPDPEVCPYIYCYYLKKQSFPSTTYKKEIFSLGNEKG